MRKKIFISTLVLGVGLAIALGWHHRVVSQPSTLYGPWADTPAFLAAGNETATDVVQAQQDFVAVADQNPGSTIGAISLFSAAACSSGVPATTPPPLPAPFNDPDAPTDADYKSQSAGDS